MNVKYQLFIVSLVITILLWGCNSDQRDTVYIDTNILIEQYQGMQDARQQFGEKAQVWQANVDTLIEQFKRDLAIYEKERGAMTEKERELKEELLSNKQMQIQQYQEATNRKAAEEEQKMMQTVLNEINDYVKEYGKKKGYEYILGANGSGNVVYAKEENNITDEVLKGLNAEYEATK